MTEKHSFRQPEAKQSRIPAFKTIEEEAEFWDTHSSEDFADELEPVTDVKFIRPRHKTTLQEEPLPFGMSPAPPHKWFVAVRSKKYGTLKFRFLLLGDMDFKQELVQHDPKARDFTCQFLQHLMIEPVQSLEQVQSWDDTLLLRVAKEWVKEAQHCKNHPAEQVTSFEAFKQSVLDHQSETIQTMLDTMQAVLSPDNAVQQMMEKLQDMLPAYISWAEDMSRVLDDFRSQVAAMIENMGGLASFNDQISSVIESIVGSFIPTNLIPPVVHAIQQAKTDQELRDQLQKFPVTVEEMRGLEVLRWLSHQDKIAS